MANGRNHIVAGVLAAAVACSFAAPGLAAPAKDNPPTDRFIVKFKDGSLEQRDAVARRRLVEAAGIGQGLHLGKTRRLAVGADLVVVDRKLDARAAQAFMRKLRNDARVEYVQVDKRMHALFTPNDTLYPQQWHYSDATAGIGAPAAWDVATGSGVVVAVVDTGITDHADLAANLVAGYDFVSDTASANDGDGRDADPHDPGDWVAADECGTGSVAQDSSWHGTHVAGTVAAVTNNAMGVAGVAFNAKVQPLRALGKCGGFTSDIADAIVWAAGGTVAGVPANATPAEVINLSLGGYGACDPATQSAIDLAVANGTAVVVAAGNDASDVALFNPASCNNVVAVAATNNAGGRTGYSNFGDAVDLAAPGGNGAFPVLSTLNAGKTTPVAGEYYAGYQGTSMAAPHVSGVAALMQSHAVHTPALVEAILKYSARPFPASCVGCGTGLLTAPSALTYTTTPFLYVDPPPPVVEGDAGTRFATFKVRLSQPLDHTISFHIATADDTAVVGSDYVAKAGTTSWPAGVTQQDFSVQVLGDANVEPTEKFKLVLDNVVGTVAPITTYSAAIVNDDGPLLRDGVPLTDLSARAGAKALYKVEVPTGATNLVITTAGNPGEDADLYVRRGNPPTTTVFDESSTGVDTNETVTIPTPQAGTYYILVYAYTGYSGLTLTASYDGGAPTPAASLSVNDVSVVEGTGVTKFLSFTVSLSQASPVPVTFHAATADGTTSGSDYTFDARDFTIPAGTLSTLVNVRIGTDINPEPLEYFYLYLTSATNATIADAQGIGYIINDDGALISINDVAVGEGNAGTKVMTFTVSLSKAAPGPVTYDIFTQGGDATAGVDYQALNLTGQTIPQGQLAKTHTVVINGDTTVEPTEVLLAYVRNPVGASVWDGQGTGYILNDDGPTLSILDASVAEGQSGTKMMTFNVLLSQAAANDVTFDIASANGVVSGETLAATAGSDYTALNLAGQVIPAGQTSKTFQVPVSGDTDLENNEVFTLTLSNPTGGASLYDRQAFGFIYNDDGPTLSVSDATISEGNSGTKQMTFTVFLSEPKQGVGGEEYFSVTTSNVSATAGSDYVATTVIDDFIPVGQVAKTFTVPINGDTAVEGSETFRVTLGRPTVGKPWSATLFKYIGTGTITNDD
jgi:serine protease